MSKSITWLFLVAVLWCPAVRAAETVPLIRLRADDIVQESIKRVHWSTNGMFAVKWAYTEAGARRMVDFWGQHPEQKVCIQVGTFKTPPFVAPGLENPATHEDWRPAWIERRTDKFINLSEADATKVVEGMTKK
jgi:hypothetical protein